MHQVGLSTSAGFFFGRTPLIKLSPKKTWEGFFGGLVLTVVSSWYLAEFMSRHQWMICPRTVSTCSPSICCAVALLTMRGQTSLG